MSIRVFFDLNQGLLPADLKEHISEFPYDFLINSTEEKLVAITDSFKIPGFDSNINLEIQAYKNDSLVIFFEIGYISKLNLKISELIFKFNDRVGFLKAYLTDEEKKRLIISYESYYPINTDQALEQIDFILQHICEPNTLDYLLPITDFVKRG